MNRALNSGPIVWLGIIVTTCLLLVIFQTALWLVMPILLAIVSYYILSPWVNLAMSKGLTRSRAVFIVTVFLCVILVAVGMIFAPKVSATVRDWRAGLPQYIQDGTNLVVKAQASLSELFPFIHRPVPKLDVTKDKRETTDAQKNKAGASDQAKETAAATDALNDKVAALSDKYSGDIVLELAHWIPSLLLVPLLTYYFLLDGPRFKRFLVRAIPNAFFEKTLYLFYRIEDQMRRYFQGLLALTILDAICLGAGLWFLGINAPFFLASIAAVLAWLPYLGSIAGCLMVVLVTAHDAPDSAWLPYEAVSLFILVRLLDDFVFLPMTVGRSLRMHPVVTVLMILLSGAVAGISGLLLVMPVLGVVMVVGQIVGELLVDDRVMARYRHARELRRMRARDGLYGER
jgi:predicted PurR-regulated permease PerM